MSHWPLNKAHFWERVPFFRILLPFVAGILLYEYIPVPVHVTAIGSVAVVCLPVFVATFLWRKQTTVKNLLIFIVTNLFLISAAWLSTYIYDIRNHPHWFGHYAEGSEGFMVTLSERPAEKPRTWKLSVRVIGAMGHNKVTPVQGDAFVYIYKSKRPLPYHIGDTLIVPSEWQRIKNAGNPFEFDYARYAARNNIYFQQFVPSGAVDIYGSGTEVPWWVQVHEWAMAKLAQYISDKPTLGLMQAMLVGDDANMDPDIRQAYAETGIIHIVAISGSHITIFFFMVTFLLSWIRNKKYHWLKYILAIPLIWMYVLVAGMPPSAVRAACMFSLLGVGFAFQKQRSTINHLLATAFILLLAQPYWLFAVGFQLSFLAVLSIVLFYPFIYKLWHPRAKIVRALWAAAAVSVVAEILVAPLVVYYFHLFPAMFLIANVAAYMFMGVVLVLGMLIIVSSGLPPVASFFAAITTALVYIFNYLVQVFRACNPQGFDTLLLTGFSMCCIYLLVILVSVYIQDKRKQVLFAALSVAVLFLAYTVQQEYVILHSRRLVVYNISRINHVELIQGHTYAILATDTFYSDYKKGYVVRPAHIGYRSNVEQEIQNKDTFRIGNNTVLLLNEPPAITARFPVDYLVLNYKASPADVAAFVAFHPRKLIIGNNISYKQQADIAAAAAICHLPVHITHRDGAFILTGR